MWRLAPPAPPSLNGAHWHQTVRRVLAARGITDAAAAQAFLAHEAPNTNPFGLTDMDRAVGCVLEAISAGEPIAVYGDFDADGVTATALLCEVLEDLGAEVRPYIPHRTREGYGLQAAAVEKLAQGGARLLITVDCGVRAVDELDLARRLGMRTVVTDHHAPPDPLPTATAIVNPKRIDDGYGFDGFSGVGMAFKLAEGLVADVGARDPELLEGVLDLVALGTVADIVPLLGENRSLVARGLGHLRTAARPGIRALCQVAGLDAATLTAQDIGYGLGPRLNAAGRMADARVALDLLRAEDLGKAVDLAAVLDGYNAQRRKATESAVEAALEALADASAPLLVHVADDIEPGVVGLVAGRLCREFDRPALVGRREGGLIRASMRSNDNFDVAAAVEAAGPHLEQFGGHARAGGMTVKSESLERVVELLMDRAAVALEHASAPVLNIDDEVDWTSVNWALHEALIDLAPFGEGNRAPCLLARGVPVASSRVVGGTHLKLTLAGPQGALGAIAFGQGGRIDGLPGHLDLVFRLRESVWRGQRRLELEIDDMAGAGHPVEAACQAE